MKKNIYENLRKSVAWFITLVIMDRSNSIKKSLLLLATVAGFSIVTFANDEMVNHDTVRHIKAGKQNNISSVYADTCCARKRLNPVNKSKVMVVTTTGGSSAQVNTMMMKEKVKLMPLLQANLWVASVNADEEVFFNFKVSQIYPSAEVSTNTDFVVIQQFTQEMIAGLRFVDESSSSVADTEVTDHFMTAHFSVQMNYEDMLVKADIEMMQAFETANPIAVALPTKTTLINADAEMAKAFEPEIL